MRKTTDPSAKFGLARSICSLAIRVAAACCFVPVLSFAETAPSSPSVPKIYFGLGHDSNIRIPAVAISPDGRFFLTGAADSSMKLWDCATRKEMRSFVGHSHYVNAVAFALDGKRVISGSMDNTIREWDMVSGVETRRFERRETANWVTCLALSRDSRLLVSGNVQGVVRLFDYPTGKWLRDFTGHGKEISSVAFSPNGEYVVSSAKDATIRVWPASAGAAGSRILWQGDKPANSVAFSPDGRSLLVGSSGNGVELLDFASGSKAKAFTGHSAAVNSVAFLPDGVRFLSGSDDCTIRLWDSVSGLEQARMKASNTVYALAASSDGELAVSGDYGACELWNLRTGESLRTKRPVGQSLRYIRFDGNGNISFGYRLCDLKTGRIAAPEGRDAKPARRAFSKWHVHSPDGQTVATSGTNMWEGCSMPTPVLRLKDLDTEKEIRSFTGHSAAIHAVAFSPDGSRLVTGSIDKTIKVWDARKGGELLSITGSNSMVESVDVSPDGRLIASCANMNDDFVRIWDLQTGAELKRIKPRSHPWYASFSPDGTRLVSGHYDGTISLWDLASGREIRTFAGHTAHIIQVIFSPDGRRLASVSHDGTIRYWNIEDGSYVAFVIGPVPGGTAWLVYTDDGYWDGSRGSEELVSMLRGLEIWNIDQFAVRNNRPDIILRRLGSSDSALIDHYYAQYQKRLRRLGVKESDIDSEYRVPVASIARLKQEGRSIDLALRFAANGKPLARYSIFVNDVPVFGAAGKPISGAEASLSERITLTSGENKIEASCMDSGGAESLRAIAVARWEGKTAPNLYYLAFGVSDYADPRINKLRYPAKDAIDLGAAFKAMEGRRYARVFERVLTDGQVTRGAIPAARDFLKDARPEDVFVLFIAGHGIQVADGKGQSVYYYVTCDSKLSDIPGTAVDFDEVEALLQGIGPRQKLFLMDTCESGESDDSDPRSAFAVAGIRGLRARTLTPEGTRGLSVAQRVQAESANSRDRWIYNDVLRRSGAIVFSSSRGMEASLESDEWEQGAFTYKILQSLRSKAADSNKDGIVSVDEMRSWVSAEVAKLTGDRQHPVVDRDNLFARFGFPMIPGD
jgi:WD40 repeat protein